MCVYVCVDANRKEACMYKFLFFQLYILKSQGTSGINYLPEVTQVTSSTGEKELFTGRKNFLAILSVRLCYIPVCPTQSHSAKSF